MTPVELVADTNVVSYLFRASHMGLEYEELIDERRTGVTLLTLMELQYGVTLENWQPNKVKRFDQWLHRFMVIPALPVCALICGDLRAQRRLIGQPIDIPDAWNAATALWLDVPLVTHDRDLEGIPGLRVITQHDSWRVREDHAAYRCDKQRDYIWLNPH